MGLLRLNFRVIQVSERFNALARSCMRGRSEVFLLGYHMPVKPEWKEVRLSYE